MTYQVQTIALPEKKRKTLKEGRRPKYPLSELRPGTDDCILLDGTKPHVSKNRIASTIAHYRKNGGEGIFKVREVTVDDVLYVGVWRTA
jgi:hypothetical protein